MTNDDQGLPPAGAPELDEARILDHVLGQIAAEEGLEAGEAVRVAVERDPEASAAAAALRRDLAAFEALRCEPTGHAGLAVRWMARRRADRVRRCERRDALRMPSLREWTAAAAVAAALLVLAAGVGAAWSADGALSPTRVADAVEPSSDGLPFPRSSAHDPVGGDDGDGERPEVALETGSMEADSLEPGPTDPGLADTGPTVALDPAELGAMFAASVRDLEKHVPNDPLTGWIEAERRLALLRETRDPHAELRRRALESAGVRPADQRIVGLASEVADGLGRTLERIPVGGRLGPALVPEVSAACRALLAAESSAAASGQASAARVYGEVLDRAYELLARELPALEAGPLACALSSWIDRVVDGRRAGTPEAVGSGVVPTDLLLREGRRLVLSTLQLHDGRRPHLLHWSTPAAQLAEAGRVLAFLPAFGVDSVHADRSRVLVAAHLRERYDRRDRESPDLLAALAYGFGDLVDQEWVDHRLLLWDPMLLVPEHYVALEHIAWSRDPSRSGWARFQWELRGVAAFETPPGLRDASALLLSLAVHDAAPGAARLALLVRGGF